MAHVLCGEYGFKHRAQWVFFCPRRAPGRELGEFLSAFYLSAQANSPSLAPPSLPPKLSEFTLPKQYSRPPVPNTLFRFRVKPHCPRGTRDRKKLFSFRRLEKPCPHAQTTHSCLKCSSKMALETWFCAWASLGWKLLISLSVAMLGGVWGMTSSNFSCVAMPLEYQQILWNCFFFFFLRGAQIEKNLDGKFHSVLKAWFFQGVASRYLFFNLWALLVLQR